MAIERYRKYNLPTRKLPPHLPLETLLSGLAEPCTVTVDKERTDRPVVRVHPLVRIHNINPADYYIDPINGDDNNDGSRDAPFRSLRRLDNIGLLPGDRVLLRGGCVFRDPFGLRPQVTAGDPEHPIIITSYGNGRATVTTLLEVNDGINLFDGTFFSDDGSFDYRNIGEDWINWGTWQDPCYYELVPSTFTDRGRMWRAYYDTRRFFGIMNNLYGPRAGDPIHFSFAYTREEGDINAEFMIRTKDESGNYWCWTGTEWQQTDALWRTIDTVTDEWRVFEEDITMPTDFAPEVFQLILRGNGSGIICYDEVKAVVKWAQDGNYFKLLTRTLVSPIIDGKRVELVDDPSQLTGPYQFAWDGSHIITLADPNEHQIETPLYSHNTSALRGSSMPALSLIDSRGVIVENIDFQGGSRIKTNEDPNDWRTTVFIKSEDYTIFRNCSVGPGDGHGIVAMGKGYRIYDNDVHDVGYLTALRIQNPTVDFVVTNNRIYDCNNSKVDPGNDGHAIGLYGGTGYRFGIVSWRTTTCAGAVAPRTPGSSCRSTATTCWFTTTCSTTTTPHCWCKWAPARPKSWCSTTAGSTTATPTDPPPANTPAGRSVSAAVPSKLSTSSKTSSSPTTWWSGRASTTARPTTPASASTARASSCGARASSTT